MVMGIIEHSHMERIVAYVESLPTAGLSFLHEDNWTAYIGDPDVVLMEVTEPTFAEAIAKLSTLVYEEQNSAKG